MSEAAASWEALDKELLAMMDTFSNMVRASRIPDEESDQLSMRDGKKDRAPGDLLEIWAEKLVHAGHMVLHHVGKLKSQAVLCDFETLMNRVRKIRTALGAEDVQVSTHLATLRLELAAMVTQLESSYYGSPHRGQPVANDMSTELKELVQIAMDMADKGDTGKGS